MCSEKWCGCRYYCNRIVIKWIRRKNQEKWWWERKTWKRFFSIRLGVIKVVSLVHSWLHRCIQIPPVVISKWGNSAKIQIYLRLCTRQLVASWLRDTCRITSPRVILRSYNLCVGVEWLDQTVAYWLQYWLVVLSTLSLYIGSKSLLIRGDSLDLQVSLELPCVSLTWPSFSLCADFNDTYTAQGRKQKEMWRICLHINRGTSFVWPQQ